MAQNIEIRLVDRVSAGLGKIQGRLKSLNGGLLGINRVAAAASAALATIGGGNLIRGIVNTTARYEDLRTTLKSVTGSAQAGAQAFDYVAKFATKTQFGVEELATTYTKLVSNGLEPSEELLTTFTDAAAVTTDQIGSLTAITDLYTRSLQSQTVELMNLDRLADRGLPVYDILKEKLGVSRAEISAFSKEAGNTEKIIQALGDGINERFGGATAARIENLSTKMSNLSIAFKNAQDKIGQGGFGKVFGDFIQKITDAIENNDDLIHSIGTNLTKAFLYAIDIGKFLVANIELIGQAFILLLKIKVVLWVGNIAIAIARVLLPALATFATFIYSTIIPALNKLGLAMLNFIPGGIIVRGVVAGVAAIATAFGLLKGGEAAVDSIKDKFGDLEKTLKTLGVEGYDELLENLRGSSKQAEELAEKAKKAVGPTGEVASNTNKTKENLDKASNTYNDIIAKLNKELTLTGKTKTETKILADLEKIRESQQGKLLEGQEKQLRNLHEQIALEEKRKEAEAALPGLISETGGAFGAGSAEEVAMQEKIDHLEVLRKTDAANEEKYQKLITQIQKKYQMDRTKFQQEQVNEQFELIKSGRMAELDLENLTSDQIKDLTIKSGRELLSEMAKHNKAAFMLNKALAIKDAIISTSQGIVKALALGPIGIPLAAIIGAMGAVQIATIAQQQYTGRARGGNVDKNTPYMVGERGAEMFVPQQRGTIISAESMRNMSRGGDVAPVNVTFQIQANDTTGFDDLITSRRGLIINLINTALNERGKEGITS